jgi:hypothetical protein
VRVRARTALTNTGRNVEIDQGLKDRPSIAIDPITVIDICSVCLGENFSIFSITIDLWSA